MWMLVTAVITASILGSMHCVGMCGPLAIWASGAGEQRLAAQMAIATSLYHIGRLLTYALAGLVAGLAGQLVDLGGETLGIQLVAARTVGSFMILFGLMRLADLAQQNWRTQKRPTVLPLKPTRMTQVLLRLRPHVFRLPLATRGLVTGLLTALLPCGWLYLFTLVAAGTGSITMGPVVMIAFWLGTVPALVGLVTGTQALAVRFRKLVPLAAAVLLIVGGGYTAAGRGFANLNSLSDIKIHRGADFVYGKKHNSDETLAKEVAQIIQSPLPCCIAPHSDAATSPVQGTATP